jgi:hypothetical protein
MYLNGKKIIGQCVRYYYFQYLVVRVNVLFVIMIRKEGNVAKQCSNEL